MNLYQLGQLKKDLPPMEIGNTIKVYEKIIGESKKKSQVFEGVLIAKKHGKGINATFTLRAILEGVGTEKIYPLHSPLIEKIETVKKGRARRAKLYYLRDKSEKKARRKLKSELVKKTKD
ncbi:MAG: 50S ribosomal protein L19 [Patescibacteria group bacterium]